ncbi:MAG: hypothetical protein MZW92_46605 [Comamonadaceae bacterium]|nr:hypothetical protein [Comamonadaceae bacterium]
METAAPDRPVGLLTVAYLAWGWLPDGMLHLGRASWPLSALATTFALMLAAGIARRSDDQSASDAPCPDPAGCGACGQSRRRHALPGTRSNPWNAASTRCARPPQDGRATPTRRCSSASRSRPRCR